MTGLGWIYILFYRLSFHRVAMYKLERWRYQSLNHWGGKSEAKVKELVENRTKNFTPAEADAITDAQCLWVIRYCKDVQVCSSALSGLRAWIDLGVQEKDLRALGKALELNRTLSVLM